MVDDVTLAYFAGLFDGEGCIYISKISDMRYKANFSLSLRACVWNADLNVLQEAVRLFGGSVSSHKPRGLSRNTCYCWTLYGLRAQHFLSIILPYTQISRTKIETALRYPIRRGGTGLAENEITQQATIRETISSLNQK